MVEELKACPFCSGECHVLTGNAIASVWEHGAFSRVFCTECQARQLFHRDDAEAIAAWNTRPLPTLPKGSVEKVARAIEIAFVEKTAHHPVSKLAVRLMTWLPVHLAQAALAALGMKEDGV